MPKYSAGETEITQSSTRLWRRHAGQLRRLRGDLRVRVLGHLLRARLIGTTVIRLHFRPLIKSSPSLFICTHTNVSIDLIKFSMHHQFALSLS